MEWENLGSKYLVEKSTSKPDENVGVVSVIYVSENHKNVTSELEDLQ